MIRSSITPPPSLSTRLYWASPTAVRANVVRHDPLQHAQGSGADDLHLAEVGQVEQADALANGPMLRESALVLDGHEPTAERTQLGAERPVLGLEGRVLELFAVLTPGIVGAPTRARSRSGG